MNEYNMTSNL